MKASDYLPAIIEALDMTGNAGFAEALRGVSAELAETRRQADALRSACRLACEVLQRRPRGLASAVAASDASALCGKVISALADASEALATLRGVLKDIGE